MPTHEFQPGDIAIVHSDRGATLTAHVVTRLTKTRVVLDNGEWFPRARLWRRSDYAWSSTYLMPPDDPRVERALDQQYADALDSLRNRLGAARLGVTMADLRRVLAMATAFAGAHEVDPEDRAALLAARQALEPRRRTVADLVASARAA